VSRSVSDNATTPFRIPSSATYISALPCLRRISAGAERVAEMEFVEAYTGVFSFDANVIKLGHHGSRTSSAAEYLTLAAGRTPRGDIYTVISCGHGRSQGNTYGHPHPEVLKRLEDLGFAPDKILRTDVDAEFINDITIAVMKNENGEFGLVINGEWGAPSHSFFTMIMLKWNALLLWQQILVIAVLVVIAIIILVVIVKVLKKKAEQEKSKSKNPRGGSGGSKSGTKSGTKSGGSASGTRSGSSGGSKSGSSGNSRSSGTSGGSKNSSGSNSRNSGSSGSSKNNTKK